MIADAGRRLRVLAWLYPAALIALIVAADRGSLQLHFIARLPAADKIGHFVFIGLLSYLVNLLCGNARLRWGRLAVLRGSLLVGTLVTLEEISQLWLPHRSFELADLLADLAGIWVFGRLRARSSLRTGSALSHAAEARHAGGV